jgi:hypothetical protein
VGSQLKYNRHGTGEPGGDEEMTNRERLEVRLNAMTDAELQQAVDKYIGRAQWHTENERPFLAKCVSRNALLAQTIQERRAQHRVTA